MGCTDMLGVSIKRVAHGGLTLRERRPTRRFAETFDVETAGLRFTTTIGRYQDGRIGEIFITNHKAGSQAGIMASDSAVAASIALQYGARRSRPCVTR
jgi:hypothetical protein